MIIAAIATHQERTYGAGGGGEGSLVNQTIFREHACASENGRGKETHACSSKYGLVHETRGKKGRDSGLVACGKPSPGAEPLQNVLS